MNCKYCSKICKNQNSLLNHEIRCKLNPNRHGFFHAFDKYNCDRKNNSVLVTNVDFQYSCQFCGLAFQNAQILGGHSVMCLKNPNRDSNRQKLRNKGKKWSFERRLAHCQSMRKSVLMGTQRTPAPGGITKGYWYKNWNNDQCYLHGKWEVEVAKFLDTKKIKWYRNKIGFDYIYENRVHRYYPDFYLLDLDIFVEVKGYETEKDRQKWSQFPKKLSIIRYKEFVRLDEWLNEQRAHSSMVRAADSSKGATIE